MTPTTPAPAQPAVRLPHFALGTASRLHTDALARFAAARGPQRLWQRDASLWTGEGEDAWLGWLDLPDAGPDRLDPIAELAAEVAAEGFTHALVLGMGGSSLFPDVLARAFSPAPGHPAIHVLDSTVPAQIASTAARLDLDRTLFVVSSKSGSTIEPNSLLAWFHEEVAARVGPARAGAHFVAVTDPGSVLEKRARELGFRAVVHGIPSVGGRFSALSAFGLVPAALQGLSPSELLSRAAAMARACGPDVEVAAHPGLSLGLAVGALAGAGCDKLCLAISPAIAAFGAWLEQLVAESTGKHGRGVIPVDGEALPAPEAAGDDRLFVYIRLASAADPQQDAAIAALADAGRPVVRIEVTEPLDLAQEVFRWEMATAAMGVELQLDPFDQPDVEAAKVEARARMDDYARSGTLPAGTPLLREADLTLFADPALRPDAAGADAALRAHFARIRPGDYFAVQAFVEMNEANDVALEAIRRSVSARCRVVTTLGYGPRFLHSTGQLHKGGPPSGVFLQITADDEPDLPIPGQRYSFGVLKQAQAIGDFAVLAARERRCLRIHLASGAHVAAALSQLADRIGSIRSDDAGDRA